MTTFEQALPGVWRWAGPTGSDRCGTALAAGGEAILVDPPPLPAGARGEIERKGGPIRHVLLTSARLAPLAAPFRAEGATVWAPRPPDERATPDERTTPDGIDRLFKFDAQLPGGLLACQLPPDAAPDGEVAFLWPHAREGLLLTGDVLPVVGQTPVYLEGAAPPVVAYQAAIRALLAADPDALAPAHHAPPDRSVALATAYAAHIGNAYHRRNAAPVTGPRFLVPAAERALSEALVAPVVLRRPLGRDAETRGHGDTERSLPASPRLRVSVSGGPGEGWLSDPFACARCGRPTAPAVQTCGGPLIPRLCPACRAERRVSLPAVRVMVCAGGCCTREGARAVLSAARQAAQAEGIAGVVDVVPVSCLGECSLGPFVHVADAHGREPEFQRAFREQSAVRARRYAADEGEIVDAESELVLSRFAALVQPDEVSTMVHRLARTMPPAKDKEQEGSN
jgi:hypothetical protein